MSRNVAEMIPAIKYKASEKRTLTAAELEAIQNAELTAQQRVFLDIMLHTGLILKSN